jgi:predicted protein tyrosine phosphatase
MRVLFVCSRNRRRSPTAELIFSTYDGIEALSAGVSPDAKNPISADLIEWTDVVFAMENAHRSKLQQRFGSLLRSKHIIVLGIEDNHEYMDEDLVHALKLKVAPHLRNSTNTSD